MHLLRLHSISSVTTATVGKAHFYSLADHLPPPCTRSPWELGLVSCALSAPQYFEFSQKMSDQRRSPEMALLIPSLLPICPAQPLPASLYGQGWREGLRPAGRKGRRVKWAVLLVEGAKLGPLFPLGQRLRGNPQVTGKKSGCFLSCLGSGQ